jgi:RNA polymerase sigma-70 factor (ECF subfamily)
MEAAAHHRRDRVEPLATHRARRLRDSVALPITARPATQQSPDADSREWLMTLRSSDPAIHAEAVGRLHQLLLRAARFEVRRRSAAARHVGREQLDDVAHHSAHDALVAVLAKLDSYRGESRFTTWAYKFALLEAAVKLRRRAWQGREIPLEPADWSRFADSGGSPASSAESREVMGSIRNALQSELSRHQREVLIAVAVNGVPIDVLAERLNTSRGALYKTIHDARKKLRAHLADAGLRFVPEPEMAEPR